MESVFNFDLKSSSLLSKACKELGLTTFNAVCNHIKQLPYGRNSDRGDFTLILNENKGTCSTKHAFLKQIAMENEQELVMLCLGIYEMNEANTKGIGHILKMHELNYIPEAHTYLKLGSEIVDVTRTIDSEISFVSSLLIEEQISPKQIGQYKVDFHKTYLKQWITTENVRYDFDSIWDIRESCIKALKQ